MSEFHDAKTKEIVIESPLIGGVRKGIALLAVAGLGKTVLGDAFEHDPLALTIVELPIAAAILDYMNRALAEKPLDNRGEL